MSARPKSDQAPRDRGSFEHAGYEGARSAQHNRADFHQAAGWRPPRAARPRPDDDEPSPRSHAHRPYTAQQHRDHRHGHRALAEEARRQRATHEAQHETAKAAVQRKARPRSYMLALSGHQVRFGPVVFWIVVGTLVIMAAWSIVTATYFAFHDDVITRMISRQADIQTAYEDRLADMRAQVDRVTTRQLLDQEQFEKKLEQVLRRQSILEQRASALGGLGDPAITGSLRRIPLSATPLPKPSPMHESGDDSGGPFVPADRSAFTELYVGLDVRLARMLTALDRIELRQAAALIAMRESYESKANRIRSVLAEIGVGAGRLTKAGVGGPFVPATLASDPAAFDRQIRHIKLARTNLDRLTKTLTSVPLRQPVSGEIDTSSNFGVRLDPFNRRPAMHTGIDFRGDIGEPIRSTANGRVVSARWSGGYGRMVEVDHGNGLSTRYGHMSRILVRTGQLVKAGQIVGRMGSTGRSTGPHLHYETRIRGSAVNPEKFLRAGRRLGMR
ncbi:MAG: peptidoglycan DD-metalloendopeptidase family protein [Xanthobacteraceae bacterium]